MEVYLSSKNDQIKNLRPEADEDDALCIKLSTEHHWSDIFLENRRQFFYQS
jgi:hypothetical protein